MSHAVRYYLRNSTNILPSLKCIEDQLTSIIEPQTKGRYETASFLISEMLADVGAVNASLSALREAKGNQIRLPGKMSKFTPEQLYFLAGANNWCHHSTDEYIESNLNFPFSHPFNYHRTVIPVLNSPDFAKAFNCKPGSNMNPVDKCRLW